MTHSIKDSKQKTKNDEKRQTKMQARVPDRYAPVKDFEYDSRGNPIMDDKSDPVKWKRTMEMVSDILFRTTTAPFELESIRPS